MRSPENRARCDGVRGSSTAAARTGRAAGYVVCAVPFSTLRSVEFSPPSQLPNVRRSIACRTTAPRASMQSRARYWMKEGLSGFAKTNHPMEVWDSTYGQQGARGILMSFIQGPKARELRKGLASRATPLRIESNRGNLSRHTKNFERGFVAVWIDDPWARGAVAFLLPGQVVSSRPILRGRKAGSISPASMRRRFEADEVRLRMRSACGQRN